MNSIHAVHNKPGPSLTPHQVLCDFAIDQRYESYTADDQSVWKSAIARIRPILRPRAAIPYDEAAKATGLSSQEIPKLETVDERLTRVGWRSICVDGFIPPVVFMKLQANRVLPITRFIRDADNLGYTPVPDIIHEAAGHLPMLYQSEYRSFLQKVGEVGSRVRYSEMDRSLFKAQKHLGDLMSCPESTPIDIDRAKNELDQVQERHIREPMSPATMLARFHWWTVEYGLIGSDAQIFGAGLFSSATEAEASDHCHKERLTLECIERDYNISTFQPVLYVADSWAHLDSLLEQLARELQR